METGETRVEGHQQIISKKRQAISSFIAWYSVANVVLQSILGWALTDVKAMNMRKQTADKLPAENAGPPLGGVVIVTSSQRQTTGRKVKANPGGDRDRLATALEAAGLRVLRVNLTGEDRTSNNAATKTVRAAITRLASQCGENGGRIAVMAEGGAADAAVLGARSEWQVRSFVLLSGRLSKKAKELLAEWQSNPTLCLVSSEDKPSLRDMTDVYFTSRHPDTDIKVFEGLGRGVSMFKNWAELFPQREPIEQSVVKWVRRELSSVGRAREVSFTTEDGWQIFGNLLLPDAGEKKAPGVILLHSGRSDRYVFSGLERLLIRAGFAVLNIDWRGRGKSVNKGRYFDLSKEERANGKLDAKAAIDYLASRPGIDPERIGLVGIIHGAEHAVRGSIGDPRVKALALLTGYVPIDQREHAYLVSGHVHVMYVSCTGHKQVTETMRKLYKETPGRLVRLHVFEGGAIGYQLFELDEKFEPMIVEWLKEGLMQ